MSHPALPQLLSDALEEVRSATSSLLDAAAHGDANAVEEAVARRGLAIERLTPVVRGVQDGLVADQRRALAAESDDLMRQGHDAEAALVSMLEAARDAVASFGRGAVAVKRYAVPAGEPGGLDQSV